MSQNKSLSILSKDEQKINPQSIEKDLLYKGFIEAGLKLDASLVEPYIPEDMELQNMSKYEFLSYLQEEFEDITQKHPNDYHVKTANFKCLHCNRGKPLASFEVFTGEDSVPYSKFAYYIATDDYGNTVDIYICNSFK